jgi:hypothetical protein
MLNFFFLFLFLSKKYKMKKTYIIIALIALVALGFSSCKSQDACPAYGSVETEQNVNG